MSIDWKLWLVIGGLSLGLLGDLAHLFVCHWIPSATGRAMCGQVADAAQTLGRDATGLSAVIPDGGIPLLP
jgi:hypothetical protein